MFCSHRLGNDELREAAEVRVHDVDRHLHRIEMEAMVLRHFQHVEVDVRIFVSGESDEADLAGLFARRAPLPCAPPSLKIRSGSSKRMTS